MSMSSSKSEPLLFQPYLRFRQSVYGLKTKAISSQAFSRSLP
jgi:hypothetical protein